MELDPLQEPQVLMTAEPSLQHLHCIFWVPIILKKLLEKMWGHLLLRVSQVGMCSREVGIGVVPNQEVFRLKDTKGKLKKFPGEVAWKSHQLLLLASAALGELQAHPVPPGRAFTCARDPRFKSASVDLTLLCLHITAPATSQSDSLLPRSHIHLELIALALPFLFLFLMKRD